MLTPEAFDFVLNNELKRAVRSQNFLTLVHVDADAAARERRQRRARHAVREMARLDRPRGARDRSARARPRRARLSMVLLDADSRTRCGVIERLMTRLEHYEFTAAARDPGRRRLLSDPRRRRRIAPRVAAEARPVHPRRDARGNASNAQLEGECYEDHDHCPVLYRVLLSMAPWLRRRRRVPRVARPRTAAADTRLRRRRHAPTTGTSAASAAAGTRPTDLTDYRLVAGRQAAHRGLQGHAAVAVAAGPAGRQDHAAAGRRRRRPPARRRPSCATRSTTSLKEYITNPVVTVIVVETVAAGVLRHGRSQHAGHVPLKGQMSVAPGAGDGRRLQGFREHEGHRDPAQGRDRRAETLKFNYKDAAQGKAPRCYLQPGDTVIVP